MKKYFQTFFKLSLFFLFFIITTNSFADIIILADDSSLQGKVVREDENVYFFTSAHGTFEIRKVHVKKLFTTKSYQEDILISKKNRIQLNKKDARENYEAGERKLMLMTKKKKRKKRYEYWDYGRLSVSASYFGTVSEEVAGNSTVNNLLSSGFSGQLAYEQGLDMLLDLNIGKKKKKGEKGEKERKKQEKRKYRKTKPRPMMMPGLRVEWSYLYFTKDVFVNDDKEVSGSMWTVGLMWTFPSPHNVWGCFMLAIMPGYSFLRINNRAAHIVRDNYSFAMTTIFGYEYAIKEQVALLLHARYTYIADNVIAFHGIGFSFGLSIRLW